MIKIFNRTAALISAYLCLCIGVLRRYEKIFCLLLWLGLGWGLGFTVKNLQMAHEWFWNCTAHFANCADWQIACGSYTSILGTMTYMYIYIIYAWQSFQNHKNMACIEPAISQMQSEHSTIEPIASWKPVTKTATVFMLHSLHHSQIEYIKHFSKNSW